jgi:peptide deformylase
MKTKKLKIVLFGDPVLRQQAKPVTVFHSKIHSVIDSIADTLEHCDNGAALAAPQVGVLKRIVVIDYQDEYLELVNPDIIKMEGEQTDYEGCLSYPGYYGKVTRANKVAVKYHDRFGKETTIEREGKMARCLQHEIDHLDGLLFIDRMTEKYLVNGDDEPELSTEEALAQANRK